MTPIECKEANTTFAKDQPPYIPLPAYRGDEGLVVSCWQCETWRERLQFLFTGQIWVRMLTVKSPLQPLLLEMSSPFTGEGHAPALDE